MYAFVFSSGDVQFCSSPSPVPPGAELADVPDGISLEALVWTGSALVDRATLTTWFVDKDGNKRAVQADPSWQTVACKWRDVLVMTGQAWGVRPVVPAVRTATGSALISAMTDDQSKAWQAAVATSKLSVQSYWSDAYRDLLPEDNPKLAKLAEAAKLDLKTLFDAALAPLAA